MNKLGKETVLTAYVILMTVALAGGFLAYHVSAPSAAVVADAFGSSKQSLSVTSFNAVFDPDGVTSFKLSASVKENVKAGLAGDFVITFETAGRVISYQGFVFFDGAFGEVKRIKINRPDAEFEAENVRGTVVVTNAADNTAVLLVKVDFERPQVRKIFEPPSNVLVSFDFTSYDKAYSSKVVPVRYSQKPVSFPYYLSNFGIIEFKV